MTTRAVSPQTRHPKSTRLRPVRPRAVHLARLAVERLEDRTVLTTWDQVAATFNTALPRIRTALDALADPAFNVQIPLVQSAFARALDIAGKIEAPFADAYRITADTIEDARQQLEGLGFTVQQIDIVPDGRGDLLRLNKRFTTAAGQVPLFVGGIGGTLGFSYFDDRVAGGLNVANLTANVQPTTLDVTFGVDLDPLTSLPRFFVQDSTLLHVGGVTGAAHVTGSMNLRNLLNVAVGGDVNLNLTADLMFQSRDSSHKLHLPDLSAQTVTGALNGAVRFDNVTLTTKLPILPDIAWTGSWLANITNSNITFPTPTIGTPDLLATLRGFVTGLFSSVHGFDFLSPIASALNFKLPLVDFSLADKLGIGSAFGPLTRLIGSGAPSFDGTGDFIRAAQAALNPYGVYIGSCSQPVQDLSGFTGLIRQVVQGDRVDLLQFCIQGGDRWSYSQSIPLLYAGIGVVGFDVGVTFGGYIDWNYKVQLGLDTTGFYIDPSTHLGIGGGVFGGVSGHMRVFGFPIVSAEGRVSLDANARLSLRDPDNSDGGRIYLDELFRPGDNLLQSFLNDLQVDFTLGLHAHVEAKLDLFFFSITLFSHDWDLGPQLGIHQAIVTTTTKRPVPLNLTTNRLPIDPDASGVLTLDGRDNAVGNQVFLAPAIDGGVDVNWQGKGVRHYTGLTRVAFVGGPGNDRLQVRPGLNVPVYADGGAGDDYLEGGDVSSTLLGGDGNDTLVGGRGRNSLDGGLGDDVLYAGPGDGTLLGGAGNDSLYAGPGTDSLDGGAGADALFGGSGTATLLGGPGGDSLYGGAGSSLLIGGTTAASDDPDNGNNFLEGGPGPSTLWAGGGNDTLVAGAGRSQLHGGRGVNLIVASDRVLANDTDYASGGSNDIVWAGNGTNTIIGGGGNDTVYGCPADYMDANGQITRSGCTAHNVFRGGTGNNRVYAGPLGDRLVAGRGNDTLVGGAGSDTLVAGPGEDWLYGGDGDDFFQFAFGINQGRLRHHLSGGNGRDTLAVTTDDNDTHLKLTQSLTDPDNFTVHSLDAQGQDRGAFTFDLPSDIHTADVETLALQAIQGNNLLEVDPAVRRNLALIGGNGNDTLRGGAGITTLYGGTGNDLLVGGTGPNEFHGGTGNTTMLGGPGNDVFFGGIGDNDMRGGDGHVVMYGGKSRTANPRNTDRMSVGPNNRGSVMIGLDNNTVMHGGPGNDVLIAGRGANEIHGGGGDDVITGGGTAGTAATDLLYGGDGYEIITAGVNNTLLSATDPTSPAQAHTYTQYWSVLLVNLAQRSLDLANQINAIECQLHPHEGCAPLTVTLTDRQKQDLQNQEDRLVVEDAQNLRLQQQVLGPHVNDRFNVLIGGGGIDTIYGSPYADLIAGSTGTGRATIYASGGDDTIAGGPGGNDTYVVPAPAGNSDILLTAKSNGQNNYPEIKVSQGGVLLFDEVVHVSNIKQVGVEAGDGNNYIHGDLGRLTVFRVYINGGRGNNLIDLRGLNVLATVQAGSGNDTILGGSSAGIEVDRGSGFSTYEFDGTAGNDTILARAETYTIDNVTRPVLALYLAGQVQTRLVLPAGALRLPNRLLVQGLDGNDTITLGSLVIGSSTFDFPEVIADGGLGADVIDARAVTGRGVTLLGGPGNDTLYGTAVPDYIAGGDGDDRIEGRGTLLGGAGDDTIYGGSGDPAFEFTSANSFSWVNGGPGNDQIFGTTDGLALLYYPIRQACRLIPSNIPGRGGAAVGGGGADWLEPFQYSAVSSLASKILPSTGVPAGSSAFFGGHDIPGAGTIYAVHAPVFTFAWHGQGETGCLFPNLMYPNTFYPEDVRANPAIAYDYEFSANSGGAVQAGVLVVQGQDIFGDGGSWYFGGGQTFNLGAGFRRVTGTLTAANFSQVAGPLRPLDLHNGFSVYFGTSNTAGSGGLHTRWATRNLHVAVIPNAPESAAAVTFRVTPATTTPVAGTAVAVTVTALDGSGNPVSYQGLIHFTDTDGAASVPPDFVLTTGTGTFTFIPRTAGPQTLRVAQVAGGTPAGTAVLNVQPAPVDHLDARFAAATALAGNPVNLTVKALGRFGNADVNYRGTVHFTASDARATVPADYTFTAADGGVHTFAPTFGTQGYQAVGVTDTRTGSLQAGATILVNPRTLAALAVLGMPASIVAGVPVSFMVVAQDSFGNPLPDYRGTVHFTSSDARAGLPADYTFTDTDAGSHTFTATFITVGAQLLTTADAANRLSTNTMLTVLSAPAVSLTIAGFSGTLSAGDAVTITVTLRDRFNNLATGYRGTVHFTSTDRQAGLPDDYAFTAADNGVHTFRVTPKTAGTQTLTAADTRDAALTGDASAAVTPAAPAGLVLTGVPATLTAGTPFQVTVTAQDAYGNITPGYRGTVTFSGGGPGATLPPDYAFTAADNGVRTFTGLVFVRAGATSLMVQDKNNPTMHDGAATRVTPAAASSFRVAGFPATITAGVVGTVTVTALDAFGNVATGYAGTVSLTSSDPQASLPAPYTFTATDLGVHTFGGYLATAGTQSITVTDGSNLSITGSQTGILVTPGMAVQIQVTTSADGGSTVAGAPFDVTVMVQDAYGNTVTDYTGTVHFSSLDPYGASLPDDYTFTPADQGSVTFAGGATLYTAGTWDVTATDFDSGITGSASVTVTPAAADHFRIDAPEAVTSGVPFDVTVTALDPYGNVDVNYRGTVTFATSDPDSGVILPADYTFSDTDGGIAVFPGGFTLLTPGDQMITATDLDSGITDTVTVTVQTPDAPRAGGPGAYSLVRSTADGRGVSPARPESPAVDGSPAHRLGGMDRERTGPGFMRRPPVRSLPAPRSLEEVLDQLFAGF